MSVDTTLAQMSNVLVYSSMAAYAGALLGYATDLSGRGRTAPGAAAAEDKVLVGSGAPAEVTGPAAEAPPPLPHRSAPAPTAPVPVAPSASPRPSPGSPRACTWSPSSPAACRPAGCPGATCTSSRSPARSW